MADYVFDDQQSYLKYVFKEQLQMCYQKIKRVLKVYIKFFYHTFLYLFKIQLNAY